MASVLDPGNEAEQDPQFEPVIKLTQEVDVKTHEEDETPIFKMRAKLFRFESSENQWKERGTGDVKLLEHRETKKVRLLMRRDKTLKVCANHHISADMRLQPNVGSDRSWVWKVHADYTDDAPKSETLAIRFANTENANEFKTAFEKAQQQNASVTPSKEPEVVDQPDAAKDDVADTDAVAEAQVSKPEVEPSNANEKESEEKSEEKNEVKSEVKNGEESEETTAETVDAPAAE